MYGASAGMTCVGGGLPMLSTAEAEGPFDGINGHMSVNKVRLQKGGHQRRFDPKRDGLRQIYFHKAQYMKGKNYKKYFSVIMTLLMQNKILNNYIFNLFLLALWLK